MLEEQKKLVLEELFDMVDEAVELMTEKGVFPETQKVIKGHVEHFKDVTEQAILQYSIENLAAKQLFSEFSKFIKVAMSLPESQVKKEVSFVLPK